MIYVNNQMSSGLKHQSPRWAFIAGCGHTGTTLLAKIFSQHTDVYCNYRENGQFLLYNYFKLDHLLYTTELEASREKKSLILEKTPRHIWHIDFIKKRLPDSKFVLTVREPLATIKSLIERTGNINDSIRRYQDDTLQVIRACATYSDICLVRYEDVVKNATPELMKICERLGIQWQDSLLEFHKDTRPWFGDEDSRHTRKRNAQLNLPLYKVEETWIDVQGKGAASIGEWYKDIGKTIAQKLGYAEMNF